MKITVEQVPAGKLKALYSDESTLGFGKIFTDRMFVRYYERGKGWGDGIIKVFENFSLSPAACVFHYAQEIFEGLKAYASPDGRILLFRPERNARRFNRSASRMAMPTLPEEDFLEAIEKLVNLEKRWIPKSLGTSLYIRPTMISVEEALGVHPSSEYIFYIILSPVGAYFKEGFNPVSLYVEEEYVRAAVGGTGDAKTGGNYAASLLAGAKAAEKGFSQILWLDAKEHRYVEEVGAMNIFFVFDKTIVTPALTGSILEGVTRASVLELAQSMGYETQERAITIDEVVEGAASGKLTEAFGAGTAAVISPVGSLFYRGRNYLVNDNKVGPVARQLFDRLVAIQTGRAEDPFGWVKEIGRL